MRRADFRRRGDPEPPEVEKVTARATDQNKWVAVKEPAPIEKNSGSIHELLAKNESNECDQVQVEKESSYAQDVIEINDLSEEEDEWSRPLILVSEPEPEPEPEQLRLKYDEPISILIPPQSSLQPPTESLPTTNCLSPLLQVKTPLRLPAPPPPPKFDLSDKYNYYYQNPKYSKKDNKTGNSIYNPYENENASGSGLCSNSQATSSLTMRVPGERKYQRLEKDESESLDRDGTTSANDQQNSLFLMSPSSDIQSPTENISALNSIENVIVLLNCSMIKIGSVLVCSIDKAKDEKGIIDIMFTDSTVSIMVDTPSFYNECDNSVGAKFFFNIPTSSIISFQVNSNMGTRKINFYFIELDPDMCKNIRSIFKLNTEEFDSINTDNDNYSNNFFKFCTLNSIQEDLDKLKLIFGSKFEIIDLKRAKSYYHNPEGTSSSSYKSKRMISKLTSSRSSPPRSRLKVPTTSMEGPSSERKNRYRENSSCSSVNTSESEASSEEASITNKSNIQAFQGTKIDKSLSSKTTVARINCYMIKIGVQLMCEIRDEEKGKIDLKLSSSAIEIDVDIPGFYKYFSGNGKKEVIWSLKVPTASVVSLKVYTNAFKNIFLMILTPDEANIVRSKFFLKKQIYNTCSDADDDDKLYFSFSTTRHSTIKRDLEEMEKIFQNRMSYIDYDLSQYYLGKGPKPKKIKYEVVGVAQRSRSSSPIRSISIPTTLKLSCNILKFGGFTAASIKITNVELDEAEEDKPEKNKIEIQFISGDCIEIIVDTSNSDQNFSMKIPMRSVRHLYVYGYTSNSYYFLELIPSVYEDIIKRFALRSNNFNSEDEIKDTNSKFIKFYTNIYTKGNACDDIKQLKYIFGKKRLKYIIDVQTLENFFNGNGIEPIKVEKRKNRDQIDNLSHSKSSRSRTRSPKRKRYNDRSRSVSPNRTPSKRYNSRSITPTRLSSPSLRGSNVHFFTFPISSVHFGSMAYKGEVNNIQVIISPSTKCLVISMKSSVNGPVELRIPHLDVRRYHLAKFKSNEWTKHHDKLLLFFQMKSNTFEKIFSNKFGTDLSSKFIPESQDTDHKYIILLFKTENRTDLEKMNVILKAVLNDDCEFLPSESGPDTAGEKVIKRLNQVIQTNLKNDRLYRH